MKLKYCLLTLCLVFFFAGHVSAQIKIGDNSEPKDYSILEIEGLGGVRLPNLTSAEKIELQQKLDNNAAGLVIYDTDEKAMLFWNGTTWLYMKNIPSLNNSINGITGDQTFQLGGYLTENTTIAQGTNNLYFDATTGTFSIANNTFLVTPNDGIGVGKFPSASFDIKSDQQGNAFRYNQPGATPGSVLTSDSEGYASWLDLNPNIAFYESQTREVSIQNTSSTETPVAISDTLSLTQGVWLIIARYVATASTGTITNYGFNSWLRLSEVRTGVDRRDIVVIGQLPRREDNSHLEVTPQLIYILQVPAGGAKYQLYGDLRTNGGTAQLQIQRTNSTYGNSYFRAIRLTE